MSSDLSFLDLFFETITYMYVVTNPPTAIAIMLGLTRHCTIAERLQISRQVCLVGGFLLFIFAFFGKIILDDIFHISTEAFRVGGGLYLFTIGVSMIMAKGSDDQQESGDSNKNPFSFVITPLATPLFVGPGVITATLVKRMALPNSIGYTLVFYGALFVLVILVYLSFFLGCKFSKYLTPPVLKIIEKLAGMLITCLAIGSILAGTKAFLQNL
jgi:multiple antibiotic resistance protein